MIILKNKKKQRDLITLIIILTLIICSYIIFNIVDLLRYRGGRPNEIIYTNNITSDVKYEAYLKPNDFIAQPYITNDYSFITSLVEYIKATFTYDYVGNSDISVDYDYYIKATIVSKYLSDNVAASSKPLWNKDYILLNHKTGKAPSSDIRVTEDLNIGVDFYNNLLEAFRQTLNIPLDSRLDITFIMSIKGNLRDNKVIQKEHLMTMSIPLGVSVFDIDISKSFPDQEIMYSKEQKAVATSYMLAIVYIVLAIVIVGIAFYFIKAIVHKGKNEYEAKVNRILKQYDDRIVTVSTFIRYEKLEIVNIPSFDELLTLSDETLEPIIYWEKKNRNNREAWFSIVIDKILYCYMVSYSK